MVNAWLTHILQYEQEKTKTVCQICAHAGSRTRVTSMGGLYDTATLHAQLAISDRYHTYGEMSHVIHTYTFNYYTKPPVGFEPTTSRLLSGCSTN